MNKIIRALCIALSLCFAGGAFAQCSFSANQYSGCPGFELDLTDVSSGTVTNSNWEIYLPAPASPSTITVTNNSTANVVMNYPGKVCVVLTDDINGTPCKDSLCNVTVNANPQIKGAFNTNVTCVGNQVFFMDSTTYGAPGCTDSFWAVNWNNNGPILDSPNTHVTYPSNGVYSVTMVVVNSCGCTADTTFANAITVTAPPSAAFTGTNLYSCAQPLVSTMTVTTPVANARYRWYISSGGPFSATPNQASGATTFTYSYPAGTFNIKLVAIDTLSGCTDSTTLNAYVTAGANAAACLTTPDTSGCSEQTYTFTPCTVGATNYNWTVTGGVPGSYTVPAGGSSNTAVNIYFADPGRYEVCLITSYTGGCSDTACKKMTLGQYVNLSFTTPDSVSCSVPEVVCVTYTGTACPTCNFTWSPPGNSSPNSNTGTCYTINNYGVVTPILLVTDSFGCQAQLDRTNYIVAEPLTACVSQTLAHGSACALDTIILTNCTPGGPFTTTWNFPGANIVSQTNTVAKVTYPASGCNNFSMIVQTAQGCIDTLRDSICISPKPVVGMTVGPTPICFEAQPNLFTLTIQPNDTPTHVQVWYQGLGTGASPSFTITNDSFSTGYSFIYPTFGDFVVCYLAETNGCLGDTVCLSAPGDTIVINPPSAKFTPIYSCRNTDTVIYINNSTGADSTVWYFNGNTYIDKDTLYAVFPQCGVVNPVTLTAFNDTFNCKLTYADSTATLPCYGIGFQFDVTKGCFCAYTSNANIYKLAPNDVLPASVVWSTTFASVPPQPVFTPPSATGDSLTAYSICAAATYDACVRLTYANGCIDTLCKSAYIDISLPEPGFTTSDTGGCVPFCVTLTNTSTIRAGELVSYSWNFGDGSPLVNTAGNVSHCYTSVGIYQACLTVVDSNGCSAEYCLALQANTIQAGIASSDTITCTQNSSPNNPITFTSTSSGFVANYSWILPAGTVPGTSSNTPSITEQFANQGTYIIGLIASDQYSACVDTAWDTIHVLNPVANYTFSNLNDTFLPCPPLIMDTILDLSQNDICSWSWTFGDGSSADAAEYPGHIWIYPGTYPVSECVTSCHGCVACDTAYTITIGGPIVSMTSSSPGGGCPCLPVNFYVKSFNCDSIQFSPHNGGLVGDTAQFVNLHVDPGTALNPAYDTIQVIYCNVGEALPSIRAVGPGNVCFVVYDSLIAPIPIDSPNVSFTYTLGGCGTDSACFTNTTTFNTALVHDSINYWTFGDGTTSTLSNPCHIFPGPGNYTVTLLVYDNLMCSDSMAMNVHIAATPSVSISMTDSVGCVPFLATFNDAITVDDSTTIASTIWAFGDGGTATSPGTTTHNYTTGGTYNVTLIVTDANGCADTADQGVSVFAAISINTTPSITICYGDTGQLTGSGSGGLVWLTDYNISDTLSLTPLVWPTHDTNYILRAGGGPGCYAYDSEYVYVSTIAITQDTATGVCVNQPTVFTAGAVPTYGTITTYDWTFGDGSAGSAGQTVTHQYHAYGTYPDTLIVTNSLGCKDTDIVPVTIFDIPHAALSLSTDSVCLGGSVVLTNTSTAGASAALTTYYFTTGSPALPNDSSSPVTLDYPTAGSYTITVYQTDANGCSSSASTTFVVHKLPVADFTINTISCIGVDNVYTSTTTLGDGPISVYDWSVNGVDQGVDTPTIQATFNTIGSYPICMSVTDIYGCQDSICQNQQIVTSPVDTITPTVSTICYGYSTTVQITGTLPGSSVQWVPSVWVSNPTGDSVVISPLQTIRYQVYSYYLTCTPKVDTVTIWVIDTVPVTATADPQNIVLGLSSNITSTIQGTIDSIVWAPDSTLNCRNCPNPIATPTKTTTYYATIYYSLNGVTCSNTTSVTITVYESCNNSQIFVPNTFTPNGDGVDDVFRLRGQGISTVNYFRVFDRWGKMVYDATNVSDPNQAAWNGGLNNDLSRPENSGVFTYVFEIQCVTGQSVTGKGSVALIR